MKQNDKPILIEDRAFPFECSISYGVEPDYQTLHWHQELEICLIQNGTGKYRINGKTFSFQKGDVFLIKNDEIHLCFDDHDLVMMVVMFDPLLLWNMASAEETAYLRPFLEEGDSICNKLEFDNPHTPQLAALLEQIMQVYVEKHTGYTLLIKSLLLQFITLVMRHFSDCEEKAAQHHVSRNATEKTKAIMAYMEENYEQRITLTQLGEQFHMSAAYLCSIFQSLTGMPPMQFLIRKRISAAQKMLTQTEESVLQISESCGFQSLSNFNHQFKTIVGCSPTQYRKSDWCSR